MQITYTLNTLQKVAQQIIEQSTSKILLFDAEMGMGKTTLIKAIVKRLGSIDSVSSPTFSLVNEYKAGEKKIYHFDLYRVETEEELYDFGIEEYLNTDAWLLIEWPEIILPLLTEAYTILKITSEKTEERLLLLSNEV